MQENHHINENSSYYSILTAEVRYSDKLTDFQKVLFSDITALTNKNGYCNATNKYFSKVFNKSKSTISRSISNMSDIGVIEVVLIHDQNNEIIERRIYLKQSVHKPILKNADTSIRKNADTPIRKNAYYNNINNINNINMNKREGGTSSQNARTIERFKKPLIEDIQTYMNEYAEEKNKQINIESEAEMLFNYYEANGWRVGKNNMKDWQAAVRTWVIRSTSDYKKGNDVFISSYL